MGDRTPDVCSGVFLCKKEVSNLAELAVGYVSLVADASKMPGQIKKALGSASGYGSDVGSSIGSKISSGIGKTLKAGVAGVGVAAGGALAGSITKGLGQIGRAHV